MAPLPIAVAADNARRPAEIALPTKLERMKTTSARSVKVWP